MNLQNSTLESFHSKILQLTPPEKHIKVKEITEEYINNLKLLIPDINIKQFDEISLYSQNVGGDDDDDDYDDDDISSISTLASVNEESVKEESVQTRGKGKGKLSDEDLDKKLKTGIAIDLKDKLQNKLDSLHLKTIDKELENIDKIKSDVSDLDNRISHQFITKDTDMEKVYKNTEHKKQTIKSLEQKADKDTDTLLKNVVNYCKVNLKYLDLNKKGLKVYKYRIGYCMDKAHYIILFHLGNSKKEFFEYVRENIKNIADRTIYEYIQFYKLCDCYKLLLICDLTFTDILKNKSRIEDIIKSDNSLNSITSSDIENTYEYCCLFKLNTENTKIYKDLFEN